MIAEYDITIIHRAKRSHGNADSLSRKPCTDCKQCGNKDEYPSVTVPTPEPTGQSNLEDVVAVNTVTVEPSSNATSLAQAQANDPSMRKRELGGHTGQPCHRNPVWRNPTGGCGTNSS